VEVAGHRETQVNGDGTMQERFVLPVVALLMPFGFGAMAADDPAE
jgi:hypothetical protein